MRDFSLRSRARSFYYAGRGVATMMRQQHNAWLHGVATLLVIGFGFAVGLSVSDWKWLVATITTVWVAETMNTAFEYLCDVVSPDYNESVKHAKDIAAGAVLVCAVGAIVMGALIFLPYLL